MYEWKCLSILVFERVDEGCLSFSKRGYAKFRERGARETY